MKKYIEPQVFWNENVEPLMENIGVGSKPDEDEPILGKERGDDNEFQKEADSWSDGLW